MKTTNSVDQILAACIVSVYRSEHPEKQVRHIHRQRTRTLNERDFPSSLNERFRKLCTSFEQANRSFSHKLSDRFHGIDTFPAHPPLIGDLIVLYGELQTHRTSRLSRDWFEETVLPSHPSNEKNGDSQAHV